MNKTCIYCLESKPLQEFYRRPEPKRKFGEVARPEGPTAFRRECKACFRERKSQREGEQRFHRDLGRDAGNF